MFSYDLDCVDRKVLHCLQENARSVSSESIGERAGVSASTVRNRIDRMREAGVIRGFHPEIDYDRAGYSLHYMFLCDVREGNREEIVEGVLSEVAGVVRVGELIDGRFDVSVEVVAATARDLDRADGELERLGLEVKRGQAFKSTRSQPFGHLGDDDRE